MSFKTGDYFEVPHHDWPKLGKILFVDSHAKKYIIEWQGFPRCAYSYNIEDATRWQSTSRMFVSTLESLSSIERDHAIDEARRHGSFDTTKIKQSSCRHNWVPYVGFRECYDYCSLCDIKKT